MATSFKRSHSCTAALSAPDPAARHHRHTLLLETRGHSRASLGLSLLSHCSFLLGPHVHTVLFLPSKSLFSQPCVNSGICMVGLMVTYSKRDYATSRSAAPRAPPPVIGHCWPEPPQWTLSHSSGSVSVGWACILCPSQVWAAQPTRCLASALSQVGHASWRMSTLQDLRKMWLAAGSLLTIWWKMPFLGLRF